MECTFASPVGVLATGSYAPSRVVTNAELAARIPTTDEWIREKLGIRERRIASEAEATSDLAVRAAQSALASISMSAEEVDLIVCATATPDRLSPSTACIVQEKLGAKHAAAFDLAAVCSGFVYGMGIVAQMVAGGASRRALLIGADTFSRITNWNDRSCVFFGDGAGAVIVGPVPTGRGFIAVDMYADGEGKWNFTVPGGGSEHPASPESLAAGLHTYRMDGRAVYSTGTTVLPSALARTLARSGFTAADIDILVPHQPSINILRETATRIGLPFDRVVTIMDRFANTAGASVAMALDEANRQGRLLDSSLVAFAAVGSGWTWASALLRWSATR